MMVPLSFLMPRLLAANFRKAQKVAPIPAPAAFDVAYTSQMIVAMALLEGAAFFNVIAYLLEGHVPSLIAVGLLLATHPREVPDSIAAWTCGARTRPPACWRSASPREPRRGAARDLRDRVRRRVQLLRPLGPVRPGPRPPRPVRVRLEPVRRRAGRILGGFGVDPGPGRERVPDPGRPDLVEVRRRPGNCPQIAVPVEPRRGRLDRPPADPRRLVRLDRPQPLPMVRQGRVVPDSDSRRSGGSSWIEVPGRRPRCPGGPSRR